MRLIDHGKWVLHKPAKRPASAPLNAMFAKRESDGVDWYDYVQGQTFATDSVKFTAVWRDNAGGFVVGAATRDATALFPANQIVFEIVDYTGPDPQADFGNKVFDPASHTFSSWTPANG